MNATQRTYQSLLDQIVSRRIPAGEVLEERRLADELDVSRTPLRAAMNRLLGEGMLERLSNGSIVVRSFGVTDLLELLQIRSLLESEAAAMATGRIPAEPLEGLRTRLQALLNAQTPDEKSDWEVDNALHDLVAAYCGNRNLASMITATRRQVRMCDVERLPQRQVQAREEHLAIVQGLLSGDSARARQAMAAHLESVRRSYVNSLGYLTHGA
ncbi:GntR family transcriptional regulator [Achromobacter marplatensis]|uniref:GntR family transcriptional regulator n=1 Tax=Achromobacter marplatensis TaxID=470868 RepID=A0AA42W7M3_9BURK|nr:GntR family transcriptional regulator [Achromobacter marplatensis]MDH2049211.1 GntR family transcriptional regulator [Achromobacter marplatensis]